MRLPFKLGHRNYDNLRVVTGRIRVNCKYRQWLEKLANRIPHVGWIEPMIRRKGPINLKLSVAHPDDDSAPTAICEGGNVLCELCLFFARRAFP